MRFLIPVPLYRGPSRGLLKLLFSNRGYDGGINWCSNPLLYMPLGEGSSPNLRPRPTDITGYIFSSSLMPPFNNHYKLTWRDWALGVVHYFAISMTAFPHYKVFWNIAVSSIQPTLNPIYSFHLQLRCVVVFSLQRSDLIKKWPTNTHDLWSPDAIYIKLTSK